MVDFGKKIVNSNKFRKAAIHFQKHNMYCLYPPGTTEYVKFWDTETQRCINGYTEEDGDYIPGYYYFFLNYCPILRLTEQTYTDRFGNTRARRVRDREFADFYDYDYYYFLAIQEAEDKGKHLCVLKSRGKGYEQPYTELVSTPNGFTEMGNLKVGDYVMNPDGNKTKVVEIFEQGFKDVFELHLADGRSVRCGADHLWSVVNASNKHKKEILTTRQMYQRGLYTTHNGYNHYRYYLEPISEVEYTEKEYTIDPYCVGKDLYKTGKEVPEEYKYGSTKQRYALVHGLFDAGGIINKDGNVSLTNTSKELMCGAAEVLRSLGIMCKVEKIESFDGFTYTLNVRTYKILFKHNKKINQQLYNVVLAEINQNVAITNIVKHDYQEKSRCIMVDNENHLYLTRDYIPTHNSFKGAAMLCRNYFLVPESKSYAVASENEYLVKDGLLTKAWECMDFIDKNTAWAKKRIIDRTTHKRSGVIVTDAYGNKTEQGYRSEIIGISLKNNPDRIRGKRGKLIIWEEAGMFKDILTAWQIARPGIEEDGTAFGLMVLQGCVCAGTKIFTADGNCINVEDLRKEYGIVGWNTYGAIQQEIEHINPPSEKECVRITTSSGRTLECSKDHPILWSTPGKTRRVPGRRADNEYMKSWNWRKAEDCSVGDQVGIIESVPIFGKKKMWEPRVIGWLIGDGSYGKNKTPILSNCEKEINSYIDDNLDTVVEKSYITKDGKLYRETRIRNICDKLRDLGIYGQTKHNKRLPIDIHTYNYESVAELIGGLFDTDGYIGIRKNGSVTISIAQCQKEVLIELQTLLLHFGIHSSISFSKPSGKSHLCNGRLIVDKNGYYTLRISDITSTSRFANCIPLAVAKKQAALDVIHEYSKTHLNKHNKYVSGVYAERITKIEDIGIKPIYNLTASGHHNYIANGIITHNTGGSEGEDFRGLRELFYKPKGYNLLPLPNIWDENVADTECGFFCPTWANMSTLDKDGNRLYMDNDGNSLVHKAIEYALSERQVVIDGASDSLAIDRYVAEHPNTPSDACLEVSGNIFPKKELTEQLALIRSNPKIQAHKQVGDLVWVNGVLEWRQKKTGDITQYPLPKNASPVGSIVIWEHPSKNVSPGLYIGGCDTYDHDQARTNSLGSTFIYKRFQNFEEYYDIIVAEYTGRPATAEEYYENVRKLLMYYNAKLLYENERKGIFPYFTQKHCDYLLADQPDIISDIIGNSKVNRRKGIHMTTQIRDYGEGLIKEWLNEEYAPGRKNLTKIFSEPLLEELIQTNGSMNVDRVIALCMVMIYREQIHNTKVKKIEEENKQVSFFEVPLFSNDWWQKETASDSTPLFTF